MTDRVLQNLRRGIPEEVTAMRKIGIQVACLASVVGFLTPALASEQVYHPVNPALGGSPNNGAFLLSTAQAQGEGVNSGNNGPTINFPAISTPGVGGTNGSGTSGTNSSGSNGASSNANFRNNSVANPLGASSGRF